MPSASDSLVTVRELRHSLGAMPAKLLLRRAFVDEGAGGGQCVQAFTWNRLAGNYAKCSIS
jgi:hypothetical protein